MIRRESLWRCGAVALRTGRENWVGFRHVYVSVVHPVRVIASVPGLRWWRSSVHRSDPGRRKLIAVGE
jgi:hypothetical protein